jgi:hypothetical protein
MSEGAISSEAPAAVRSCRNATFTGMGSGAALGADAPPVHATARAATKATDAAGVDDRRLTSVGVARHQLGARTGWVV